MRKKRRIAIVTAGSFAILCLMILAVWPSLPPPDPVYHGRPLSVWTMDLLSGKNNAAATKVLNEAGTNAIPTLLRMLRARDSTLKASFFDLIDKQHLIAIPHVDTDIQNTCAQMGFNILGSRAAPAVPELVRIYDRERLPRLRARVAFTFCYIGPAAQAAVPLLLRETQNTNDEVRGSAYIALGGVHADPNLALPILIKGLQDNSYSVRADAAQGLENFGPDAKSAVPALIECFKKVSLIAVPSPPSGAAQFPAILVKKAAIEALKRIDPDAAAKLAAELNETW